MRKKNYHSFSADADTSQVDYVIIGSGIGGLTVATWLAKTGKKVIVLERHYVPGGFTHSFKRKHGFQWDVGVHYVGNVGKDDDLKSFFDYLTDGALEWESMGEVYDVAYIGENKYEFKATEEAFIAQMSTYFPEEQKAIEAYVELIQKTNKRSAAFFFEKTFEPILRYTVGSLLRKRFKKYASRTTADVLSELTSNKTLIAVLCAQCGNYGLSPSKSSFAAHALIVGHFIKGGHYPVGGADQICLKTIDVLNSHGGSVYINAEVNEIRTKNQKVEGVQVGDRFIPCKEVISNIGIQNTFEKLLTPIEKKYCGVSFDKVPPAIAHICLYVGLDASSETLELPKHNVWWYANEDIDGIINTATPKTAPENFAYISFPSSKDPQWDIDHPNTATIQAITVGNYDWFKAYEDQPWRNRDEAYKQMKKDFEDTMLSKLYTLFPQIEGHVQVTEVSTPLSTKHFSNYQKGEIYGLAHSPERFNLPFLRPKTKIKGLRLVGQDITVVGVAGAMLSGMLCATTILKFKSIKNFKEINSYK